MKRRFVAVLCCVTAAACGSSDHPAQDPSTATTTHNASSETVMGTPSGSKTASTNSSTDAMGAASGAGTAVPGGAGTTTHTEHSETYAADTEAARADAGMINSQATSDVSPGAASSQGTAETGRNADNTAVNRRDRRGALTPMDQGGKDSERQMTAAIRRSVMADKSLSFAAKNVKIITMGSKVTLRGTVKTEAEKASIETDSRQVTGVTDVDNQIDVKAK